MATKNAQLIELIRNRKGSGEFGYGITTADKYVQHAVETIGHPMLSKHFHCIGNGGVEGMLKRAAGTLTICSGDTETEKSAAFIKETEEKKASSIKEMAKILGCEPPPHAMIAMINKLTTPREDRDGDTLQTIGANMDPKSLLLYQHVHTLPIGKMVRVVSQDKECLRVATVLLDINELTSDCGKLFEAGAFRFSHGFIAKEFEERKGAGDMARFNILKFDIVEESAVSVPSNVDAEVELFCSGKLHSDAMKAHAKSLFDRRNKSMAVTEKVKAAVDSPCVLDEAIELSAEQEAALKAAKPEELEFKSPTVEERVAALEQLVAEKFNENHDANNGQFSSGDGGSSGGSAEHSYGGDHGKLVSVADNGQVTLTKPKTHEESLAQLKAMEKIVDAAMKDMDNDVPKASLRLNHVVQQLKRAMGFGKKVLASKDVKAQLETLIEKLEKKYGIKADSDPSDEDHELKGVSMNGTKLDSPIGDNTMVGPTPNTGESQSDFMERCMLDGPMMDNYPTEDNRQAACKLQWGKSAALVQKDMGKCKDCGKKADLNKEGLCADCAKQYDDGTDDSGEPKGGKPQIKAGRVLSQRNVEVLSDAVGDMDAMLAVQDLPRTGKALATSAKQKVKFVIDSATPGDDPQPSGVDHVLREAILEVSFNVAARDKLRKAIEMLDKADENEQLAESFRELEESVLSPG